MTCLMRFSTLSLASIYWQAELANGDYENFASIIPTGFYEFKTDSFRLGKAAAFFPELINRLP